MNHENLDLFIGYETMTIVEALKKIDENALGVLFIVDSSHKLTGALSDGDIRRSLIKNGDLGVPVDKVMNTSPHFLQKSDRARAYDLMEQMHITAIPIVDCDMRILSVISRKYKEDDLEKKSVLSGVPVVMMAGGKGTRLYPYTKILPKPLIPIGEHPIAEMIMDLFAEYGCEQFFMVVNHKKNMIKAYFNEVQKDYRIEYVDEDIPLGTGGGIALLKGRVNTTFVLTNCDILIEEDYAKILRFHRENQNQITMVCSLKNFRIPYGIIHLADQGTIKSMEEKPTISFFTNTGCYIVEPEVIEEIPENVEIGFPDIIEKFRAEGRKVGVYPISENAWMDMGQLDSLEEMRSRMYQKGKGEIF